MSVVFIRVIILYALIVAAMRVMGKRQLGELEPTELVMAMIISDLAAVPMQDMGIPLLTGIIPIITLVCLSLILSEASVMSIRFRRLMSGSSSIIIDRGQINQHEMRRNRLTVDELLESLRLQGVLDISVVKYAVLESNGQLSVIPYPSESPVTPSMLNIQADGGDMPVIIVNCGHILDSNLISAGRDRNWLEKQLKERRIKSVDDIYLLTVDEGGRVYVQLRREGRK